MEKVIFKDIGVTNYKDSWDYQKVLFQGILDIKIDNRKNETNNPTPSYLLFTEHSHVYTLGKSGDFGNLLLNEKQLEERNIAYYKTNRGGDITYHGPGQLVGYPILNLDYFYHDIHRYMRDLEDVIISTIADYGLKGERSNGETGVWLDVGTPFARKICAFGVRASRWVTMHGFALNVNPDLGYFDHIIPCGIRGKGVTSMEAELNKKIPIEGVKSKLLIHFSEVFKVEFTG